MCTLIMVLNCSFLRPGVITVGDALGAMPFRSDLVLFNMTGSQIRKMFEYAVEQFTWLEDPRGEFVQVSGTSLIVIFQFLLLLFSALF